MIIALPYGVEGFAPIRHLTKEDGVNAKVDETLDFKVIEFSKENKKIILSHSKIFRDIASSEKSKKKEDETDDKKSKQKSPKVSNDNKMEKTTLGDLAILGEIKTGMEQKKIAADKLASQKEEEEASAE